MVRAACTRRACPSRACSPSASPSRACAAAHGHSHLSHLRHVGGIAGGIPPGGMEPPLMRLSRTIWGSGAWRESGYGEGGGQRAAWEAARCARMTAEEDWVFSLAAPRRGSSALRAAVARGVRLARTTRRARYPRGRARPRLPVETENARGTGTGAHLTAARQDVRTHGSELELRRRLTAGRGVGGHPRGRNARGGPPATPLLFPVVVASWGMAGRGQGGVRGRRGRGVTRRVAAADNLPRSAPRGGEASNRAGGTARDGRT